MSTWWSRTASALPQRRGHLCHIGWCNDLADQWIVNNWKHILESAVNCPVADSVPRTVARKKIPSLNPGQFFSLWGSDAKVAESAQLWRTHLLYLLSVVVKMSLVAKNRRGRNQLTIWGSMFYLRLSAGSRDFGYLTKSAFIDSCQSVDNMCVMRHLKSEKNENPLYLLASHEHARKKWGKLSKKSG